MPLNLCIVGCGWYAGIVIDDLRAMDDEVTLYFASRDEAKAREFNERYGGAGFFGSYEDAARDSRVEAMYFFLPHHLHLEGARLAAKHSKHILMEKPIARTVPEARQLIRAAGDGGVALMVAENCRFGPTVEKAKELIAQGEIGNIRLIQLQAEQNAAHGGWRTKAELSGGGVLIDGGVHYVDVLLNLGGFPQRVYAAVPPKVNIDTEGEDGAVITAHLPGGAIGLIHYSSGTSISEARNWVHVTGTKGELRFEPLGSEIVAETPDAVRSIELPDAHRGVRRMISEFVSAVRDGREPIMSGLEGLKDLAVVLAAYESAASGQPVSPEETLTDGSGGSV